MQSPAPRTRIGWFLLLFIPLAAASTARADVIFVNDVTGGCSADATGSLSGTPVNGGTGLTLWGDCSSTSPGSGGNSIHMEWEGDVALGSLFRDGDPFPFSYDFSVTSSSGGEISWILTLLLFGYNHDSPEYTLDQGVTAPGGGNFSSSSTFPIYGMTPFYWGLDFTVWSNAATPDTLNVHIPRQSSIDLDVPASGSATPEPSGVLLTLTGLVGTLSLASRRRLPK
jgi:hypothetical protein